MWEHKQILTNGKNYHAKGNQKKYEVAILTLYKIEFKKNSAARDKAAHYIMIKRSNERP